jgi:dipeptidyl aminopeptidase/acylaminoacyl peptidase
MSRSEVVHFESGGNTLAGTLHWPAGEGPHPALVMLQGSGPADRDSGGYFPPIRDHFLSRGLAVLSWDKPGIGGSTGHWTRQTAFDRADDAIAALDWLRARPGIDRDRVGIWGHSQGGWIGPLAASQYPDLAFLIVNSGPGIRAQEQDLYGVEHTLRANGASDADVDRGLTFMRALHEAGLRGAPYDEVAAQLIEPARGTPEFDYFGEVGPDLWYFLVRSLQRPFDPVPALENVTCPILAIFGENDTLVPVEKSVRVFESARATVPDRDITTLVFPGADHRIKLGDPPDFAPGYLEAMTDWIWDRIGHSTSASTLE